jgi:hypothetical protein
MKKLTTVILVLSLVLGGVALAAAADVPQTTKNLDLNALQKITDQEAQEIRGTLGFSLAAAYGIGSLNIQSTTYDRFQTRDMTRTPARDGSCK